MNPVNPTRQESAALREALSRDAGQVPQPPFDAALHGATMRRIRALAQTPQNSLSGYGPLAWATLLVVGFVGLTWGLGRSPRNLPTTGGSVSIGATVLTPVIDQPRAVAWVYQQTAAQGEEALLAMLDRDARALLPRSASAFSNPLDSQIR